MIDKKTINACLGAESKWRRRMTSEQNTAIEERIKSYVETYITRFNELCVNASFGASDLELLTQPIHSTLIYMTSDAFFVLYSPKQQTDLFPEFQPGVFVLDQTCTTVAHLAPSLTTNRLKISALRSGPVFSASGTLIVPTREMMEPPDVPLSETSTTTLSPELIQDVRLHPESAINTQALLLAPPQRIKNGFLGEILAQRHHIFSPILIRSTGARYRQYFWSCADIFWRPEQMEISDASTRMLAEADFNVIRRLEQMQSYERTASPSTAVQGLDDPYKAVAKELYAICDRFQALIDHPDVEERQVQDFLEQTAHHFLLSSAHQNIFPHKPLGHYIPDFVVRMADNKYKLIEIEAPQREIYQPVGEEPSAHLTHAIQQVEDWLRYVDDNRQTVRQEYDYPGIYYPEGEVIAGREYHLNGAAARRFAYKQTQTKVKLRTYDDILRIGRDYSDTIKRMSPFVNQAG